MIWFHKENVSLSHSFSSSQMNDLPYEILHQIFGHLPLHILVGKIKKISKTFLTVANDVGGGRLLGLTNLLNGIGHVVPNTSILPNVFDIEEMGLFGGSVETLSPFKTWLLVNLEYPNESNVITAIELILEGTNLSTGQLTMRPTGEASFGMWVDHVGYFPITAPYEMTQISFPPSVDPTFRLWSHVDEKSAPGARFILNQPNSSELLPSSKVKIKKEKGCFRTVLHDSFGPVGSIKYQITTAESDLAGVSSMPPTLRGSELMLHHLEQEIKKVVGEIELIYINPQVLLSIPI
jgi:hypothetical protein